MTASDRDRAPPHPDDSLGVNGKSPDDGKRGHARASKTASGLQPIVSAHGDAVSAPEVAASRKRRKRFVL